MKHFGLGIKSLSVFLALLMIAFTLPLSVFAAEKNGILPYDTSSSAVESVRLPAEDPDIYSLVYGKSDGTKECIVYDYPIKYADVDGSIKDKSLSFRESASAGKTCYVPEANDIITSVPSVLSEGICLRYGDTDLRLVFTSSPDSRVRMSEDMKTASFGIGEKTNLEYSLTYNGFKENIVLEEYTGVNSFSFLLYTGGLSLIENGGDWFLTDSEGTVRAEIGRIIIFTADEKNNAFGNIDVACIEENSLYSIVISADEDYLKSPDTAYPVSIDPTIEISYANNGSHAIEDISVCSTITYSGDATFLFAGKNSSGGIHRCFFRFPYLDLAGKNIVSAELCIRDLMCESQSIAVECRKYTGPSWNEAGGLSWPSVEELNGDYLLDKQYIFYGNGNVYDTAHWYSFDITALAQDWSNGISSPSKGVYLKSTYSFENGNDSGYKTIGSFNRAQYKPYFKYSYVDAYGINGSYEFYNQPVGSSVNIYNNVLYGNAVITDELPVLTLSEFPIAARSVLNTALDGEFFDSYGLSSSSLGKFGTGVKPSFVQLLKFENGERYLYVDDTGTEYYFTYNSEKDRFENKNLDGYVIRNQDSTADLHLFGNTVSFSSAGLIQSVSAEKKTYTYVYSSGKLSEIREGTKTLVSFGYSGGYLSSASFGIIPTGSSSATVNTVSFGYSGGKLTSVTDPLGRAVQYTYTSGGINIYDCSAFCGCSLSVNAYGRLTGLTSYRISSSGQTNTETVTVTRSGKRISYSKAESARKTSYLYDKSNKLVNILETDLSESTVYDATYYGNNAGPLPKNGSGNLLGNIGLGNTGSRTVNLTAGNYVFSAFVNADDLFVNNTSYNALISVTGAADYSESSKAITGTKDLTGYVRLVLPFTVTTGGNYTLSALSSNNSAQFVGFQLEEGRTVTPYGIPWSTSSSSPYSITTGFHLDYEDERSVTVPIGGSDLQVLGNNVYLFSCFIDCDSDIDSYTYADITFYDTDGCDFDYYCIEFDSPCSGLQYVSRVLDIREAMDDPDCQHDPEYIDIYFYNDNEDGIDLSGILISYAEQVSEEEAQSYSTGLSFVSNNDGTCRLNGIGSCNSTDIVIPEKSPAGDRVTRITNNAFYENEEITSVIIPQSVTQLDTAVFCGCTALESVTIYADITEIPASCFYNCHALTSVNIPDTVTTVRQYAFYGCTSLESVFFPDSVTELLTCLFEGCTSLSDVTLGNGITVIPANAFKGCTSLKRITLPEDLETVRYYSFYNCTSLSAVGFYDSVTSIEEGAFSNTVGLKVYYSGTSSGWSGIQKGSGAIPYGAVINTETELNGNFAYRHTYDNSGDITSTEISYVGAGGAANAGDLLFTSVIYDSNGLITEHVDENGCETRYEYDGYGQIVKQRVKKDSSSFVDTVYTFSGGNIQSVSCSGQTNTYSYSYGLLSSVTHTGPNGYTETYYYVYDAAGNLTNVKVGSSGLDSSSGLVSYTYNTSGVLTAVTYPDGSTVGYTYDGYGNLIEQRISGVLYYIWFYDNTGNAIISEDLQSGRTEVCFPDKYGYVAETRLYNSTGTEITEEKELFDLNTSETYDAYDRIVSFAAEVNEAAAGNVYDKTYSYSANGSYSSYLVSGESFSNVNMSDVSFSYTYDARGNLTSVSEGGVRKQTFAYDDLNQLIREDNAYTGKTYLYSYDGNGNILTKDEYSYTLGTPSGTHVLKQYSYGDTQWKDLLTSYGGTTISYSGGNPTNWRNASSMSWTGRTLDSASFTGATGTAYYKYDESGLRTRKTIGNETTEYVWDGSDLIAEIHQDYKLKFIYKDGEIAGFTYVPSSGQNSTYYYGKDNFGVIKLLFDGNGNRLAEYTYDAWGVPTGTTTYYNDVGVTVNPIRYKGYYYDTESGFYYLQSRYYDPVVSRFLNLDYIVENGNKILKTNLFEYCNNNPLMFSDPNGREAIICATAVVVYLVVAIIALCMTTIVLSPDFQKSWNSMCSSIASTVSSGIDSLIGEIRTSAAWISEQSKQIAISIGNSFAKVKSIPKYKTTHEWHHIVAQQAHNANLAKAVLRKVGININSNDNLVLIKTGFHRRIHTNKYYGWANSVVISAFNAAHGNPQKEKVNVRGALLVIRKFIESLNAIAPF